MKQQFAPTFVGLFINPFYFTRRALLKYIKLYAPQLEGVLLDFGCGSKPYKDLFVNIEQYIGIDFENGAHDHNSENIDLFYDGKRIPFEDNKFDAILTTQVLEHVSNIDDTLAEIRRVLKPNGKVLISLPFVWPEHEMPFDYRRYTAIGIEEVLHRHKLTTISSKKSGTYFEVLVQLWISFLLNILPAEKKWLKAIFIPLFIIPANLLGGILSPLFKKQNLYFDIVLLAQKEE